MQNLSIYFIRFLWINNPLSNIRAIYPNLVSYMFWAKTSCWYRYQFQWKMSVQIKTNCVFYSPTVVFFFNIKHFLIKVENFLKLESNFSSFNSRAQLFIVVNSNFSYFFFFHVAFNNIMLIKFVFVKLVFPIF